MSKSPTRAAYAPDGTEVLWTTSGKWDVVGMVQKTDGRWVSAVHGSSWDSVRSRTITYKNRTYNNVAFHVAGVWEVTAPAVREYFGTHQVNIARVFKPCGGGWVDTNMHAGRSNIRKLSKQGVTSIEFRRIRSAIVDPEMGVRGFGDVEFPMTELLKSMRLPAQKMCATSGHGHRPATHKISYDWRNEGEVTTELVCSACAESYSRRPVLTNFTSHPLAAPHEDLHL